MILRARAKIEVTNCDDANLLTMNYGEFLGKLDSQSLATEISS